VETPAHGARIVRVPEIRAAGRNLPHEVIRKGA
jgi:hypothetical protein